jgi:sulfide:quinone oxidoreductase
MYIRHIAAKLSVGAQITSADVQAVKDQGYRAIICNRPDSEADDQPTFDEIEPAAKALGTQARYLTIASGMVQDEDAVAFGAAMSELPNPVLAYCRTGTRSATLWALSKSEQMPAAYIVAAAKTGGHAMSSVVRRIVNGGKMPVDRADASYDIVVVGGGAGISVAAGLRSRCPNQSVAIIDPTDVHYYQLGWTMVGAGIFEAQDTAKTMASLFPVGVKWIKSAVAAFEPEKNAIILDGCRVVKCRRLIVCPGIKLDWNRVEDLVETLGKNGVTSNYHYDLGHYTWELVSNLKKGPAIFTQPPMPIKCAGAPPKAMYLSGDAWYRNGALKDIDIHFTSADGVLFGVKDYVPALQKYVEKYDTTLNFFHNHVAVDGAAKKAWFDVFKPDTPVERVEMEFDMMHVCPPQTAPDFIRVSSLADKAGWVDVDQATLRHKTYDNIWSLGDVMNAPNAKAAPVARNQAAVVAENVASDIEDGSAVAQYNGYGSSALTVELGKIVLAEFGYGGVLLPSFPKLLHDDTWLTRAAWFLKEKILPPIYWKAMLRGREWLAQPEKITAS